MLASAPVRHSISERNGRPSGQPLGDVFAYPIGKTAITADRRIKQDNGGIAGFWVKKGVGAVASSRAMEQNSFPS
jgi:hypothetical protein